MGLRKEPPGGGDGEFPPFDSKKTVGAVAPTPLTEGKQLFELRQRIREEKARITLKGNRTYEQGLVIQKLEEELAKALEKLKPKLVSV